VNLGKGQRGMKSLNPEGKKLTRINKLMNQGGEKIRSEVGLLFKIV